MNKKSYIKILGMFAALLAFMAVSVTAAQAGAPRWTTRASGTLGSGASKGITSSNTGTVKLGFSGQTLKSTTSGDCTASTNIDGSGAGSPGTAGPFTLTCKNVESSVANCTPHSPGAANGTIVTNSIDATLVWLASTGTSDVGILFEPSVGTTFAEIEETGAACAVNTEGVPLKVTEKLICKVEKGVNADVAEGAFECPTTPILSYWTNQTPVSTKDTITQLKVAGALATFTGTFDVKPSTAGEEIGIEIG